MEEIGWTQKQLAEALNCTQQHVSTILKGNANMTLETLAKLERALQFDLIGTALTIFPDSSVSIGFFNSPEPNENTDAVNTSTLVDGYKPRKKKGPKRNSTKPPIPHHGMLLKEKLQEMGMSVNEFAKLSGISRQIIYEVISGKSSISPELATVIEKITLMDSSVLLNWQRDYDEQYARQ